MVCVRAFLEAAGGTDDSSRCMTDDSPLLFAGKGAGCTDVSSKDPLTF